jgi:hypothetical protein
MTALDMVQVPRAVSSHADGTAFECVLGEQCTFWFELIVVVILR